MVKFAIYNTINITIDWFDLLVSEIYSILQSVYAADAINIDANARQTHNHYWASASPRQQCLTSS